MAFVGSFGSVKDELAMFSTGFVKKHPTVEYTTYFNTALKMLSVAGGILISPDEIVVSHNAYGALNVGPNRPSASLRKWDAFLWLWMVGR